MQVDAPVAQQQSVGLQLLLKGVHPLLVGPAEEEHSAPGRPPAAAATESLSLRISS
jgi:hypothetical protein